MSNYNPLDWYWKKADGSLYSSARDAIVTSDDEAFQEWQSLGNAPTPWPKDSSDVESNAELGNVLSPYGVGKSFYVPAAISRRQFFQACAVKNLISQDDAFKAVTTGDIPGTMLSVINKLPAAPQFNAKMAVAGSVEFQRNHPLVAAFASAFNMKTADVDALFVYGASL